MSAPPPPQPRPRRLWLRRTLLTLLALFLLCASLATWYVARIVSMPGPSHSGPLPPLTPDQQDLRSRLDRHVRALATDIGQRNRLDWDRYLAAQTYITDQFRSAGCTVTIRGTWRKSESLDPVGNVEATVPGSTPELLILGAHYDTVRDCPGADDNASGVASLLELARLHAARAQTLGPPRRTLRFVAFFNEERWGVGPWGALGYAQSCRDRNENIAGMMSLETIGYYTDAPDSQNYPAPFSWFYPSTGNFIAFVANDASRDFVRQTVYAFRTTTQFPSKGAAVPPRISDAGRSDHAAFWRHGYPALMVTDTANFRNPHYHRPTDTPDTLDYARLARVTAGLDKVIDRLAR